MPARREGDAFVVPEQSEANRLYNRGRYGRPLSGGALRLEPVEAAYLAEVGRLTVSDGAGPLRLSRLIEEAAGRAPGFEAEFLVYRDLRTRGYLLDVASASDRKKGIHFRSFGRGEATPTRKPTLLVTVRSEREHVRGRDLAAWCDFAERQEAGILVAVVDEESDITYFEVGLAEPRGKRASIAKVAAAAVLVRDRVLVWDPEAAKRLHGEGFLGKPVAGGLHLSLIESIHLAAAGGLEVRDSAGRPVSVGRLKKEAERIDSSAGDRLAVYADLRSRALAVKTGFKFGTHFRAYVEDPKDHHAPFLVHVVDPEENLGWPTLARATRLSPSVRKEFLLAWTGSRRLRYLSLRRQRP